MDPATNKGLEIVEYIRLFLDHAVPLRLVITGGSEGKVFMLCVCVCVCVCVCACVVCCVCVCVCALCVCGVCVCVQDGLSAGD